MPRRRERHRERIVMGLMISANGKLMLRNGKLFVDTNGTDCCCGECLPSDWSPCEREPSAGGAEECDTATISGSSAQFNTEFEIFTSQDCADSNTWTVDLISVTNGTVTRGACSTGGGWPYTLDLANGFATLACYDTDGYDPPSSSVETILFRFTHDQTGNTKDLTITVQVDPSP